MIMMSMANRTVTKIGEHFSFTQKFSSPKLTDILFIDRTDNPKKNIDIGFVNLGVE